MRAGISTAIERCWSPGVHLAHGTYSGGITNKEQVQVRRNPVVLEYIEMCRDELRFCPKSLSAHIQADGRVHNNASVCTGMCALEHLLLSSAY